MKIIELEDHHLEEIHYLLIDIENKFNIEFEDGEIDAQNLHYLDQIVINKIGKEKDDICTSQKVFYKIRNIFESLGICERSEIHPKTLLKDILPKKDRRKQVKIIESTQGIRTNILTQNSYLLIAGFILFLLSIPFFYISTNIAFVSLLLSVFIIYLAFRFERTLYFENIKELIQDITGNNYLYMRKDTQTINESEIKHIVRKWLSQAIEYNLQKEEKVVLKIKNKQTD